MRAQHDVDEERFGVETGGRERRHVPVSYTHLDVYKRQIHPQIHPQKRLQFLSLIHI
ncbi:hypothetical protein [Burkholderia plantarii]|uniref:hypothetical protein n=1 Tax=Burkholderia plantarii TaxID=41899 RepID=UPI003F4A21BC